MSDESMFSPHPSEDLLEQFAMNKLAEEDLARVEEHLLLCTQCQESVEEIDAFIQATKQAAAQLPAVIDKPKSRWSALFASPMPVVGVAMAAIVITVTTLGWRTQFPSYQAVELEATRGAAAGVVSANAPVRLNLDVIGLPENAAFTVELVDDLGRPKWDRRDVRPSAGRLSASVPERLRAGQYFVRVYSNPLRNELLREYGLAVR